MSLPGRRFTVRTTSEDDLHVTVRDNGPGFRDGVCDGVGLENTRGRLEESYGDRYTFEIDSGPFGTTASLAFPVGARGGRA